MKIFSTQPKYFDLYFSEALNLADFKQAFRFIISFVDQKLQSSKAKNVQKWAKTGKMDTLWPIMRTLEKYQKTFHTPKGEFYNQLFSILKCCKLTSD